MTVVQINLDIKQDTFSKVTTEKRARGGLSSKESRRRTVLGQSQAEIHT
jgi:hypothetical protein